MTKVGKAEVGPVAKGLAFGADGKFFHVGNYLSEDTAIFKVQSTKLVRAGPDLKLPGRPAALGGSTP